MKVGFGQINTIVGDLKANCVKILSAYKRLCGQGAELVIFPELVVTGYPPQDLLFKNSFVRDNLHIIKKIANEIKDVPAVIGFIEPNDNKHGRRFYNAAAWVENGEIKHTARKCLLPSYDVFDEDRYFQPGSAPLQVHYAERIIGLTLCEDIWMSSRLPTCLPYDRDPVQELAKANLDLLINLSASPWHYGKNEFRTEIVKNAASRCGCSVVYCNAVGGNDELIFDGRSMAVSPSGKVLAGLAGFEEECRVVDISAEEDIFSASFSQNESKDIHDALVLGLEDYATKSGFKKALIGLSGGIDSAVTAVLAVKALGAENIIGVSLPSAFSSQHSQDDAIALANRLDIRFHTIPIKDVVDASESTLAPLFKGRARDVTEENLQARIRGLLLMAMSNKFGALLLTTGNKSELSVGYCTLYGDMCGGLAVLSDLFKSKVYKLASWINREEEIIPENSIQKAPSAELRPNQKDSDSLPPYDILDDILNLYVEKGYSSHEIIKAGHNAETVRKIVRMVDLNEYKRRQAPPGLKISPLAFGTGRRIPIVQGYVG